MMRWYSRTKWITKTFLLVWLPFLFRSLDPFLIPLRGTSSEVFLILMSNTTFLILQTSTSFTAAFHIPWLGPLSYSTSGNVIRSLSYSDVQYHLSYSADHELEEKMNWFMTSKLPFLFHFSIRAWSLSYSVANNDIQAQIELKDEITQSDTIMCPRQTRNEKMQDKVTQRVEGENRDCTAGRLQRDDMTKWTTYSDRATGRRETRRCDKMRETRWDSTTTRNETRHDMTERMTRTGRWRRYWVQRMSLSEMNDTTEWIAMRRHDWMNDILSDRMTHQNDPRDETAQDRIAQRVTRDRTR